jgi:hypothetical protein
MHVVSFFDPNDDFNAKDEKLDGRQCSSRQSQIASWQLQRGTMTRRPASGDDADGTARASLRRGKDREGGGARCGSGGGRSAGS